MIGRIPILDISPVVENGEFPAKAVTGERLWASATIFREGHDYLRANVVLKDPSGAVLKVAHAPVSRKLVRASG